MNIHETLLLLLRFAPTGRKSRISFGVPLVKDGPLSIRAQYSKLVEPIRQFLAFARDQDRPVHLLGQEKSGTFFDHFQFISREAPSRSLFIPGDA